MKIYLAAALLSLSLAIPAQAEGVLFQKDIEVSAAEYARRTGPPADPTELIEALRWQVLNASNYQRALAGLPALKGDPVLDNAAAAYSRKMRDFQFFDHVAPDGETLDGRVPDEEKWRYQGLGENLWSGQGALDWRSDLLAARAAENWIESPSHRENLLDPTYTLGGVGAAMRGDQLYITMLYGTPHEDLGQAELQRDFGDAPDDLPGFTQALAQSVADTINASRGGRGIGALNEDALLSQIALGHSGDLLITGGLSGKGPGGVSILEKVFQSDPSLSGRLSAGFWRGSGGLVWEPRTVTDALVDSWRAGQSWSNALDPGFTEIGIGAASDGNAVVVTVLFWQRG